jgi:indolepyruvate ferredoxin oxidoreductase
VAVPYAGVDGVVGAWYGKGPGLDRSGDVLKHANLMASGPGGGAVLFVGDDPSATSSTLPYDTTPVRGIDVIVTPRIPGHCEGRSA